MPKVSVIIPTYNHEEFIVETINSVLNQSFQDFELIVVNDGSPDQTENILKSFIDNGLIKYVRQENQGVAIARNNGLHLSVGEYIAFLDDDDAWHPNKLEWQAEFIDSSDAVLIGGDCYYKKKDTFNKIRDDEQPRQLKDRDLFRRNPFVSPGQTLIRRSAIEQLGGFDPTIWGADDLDLWIRLSRVGTLFISTKPALFYRLHQFNASNDTLKMAINLDKVFKKNLCLYSESEQSNFELLAYRFIFRYCGRKIIWKFFENLIHRNIYECKPLLRYCIYNIGSRSLKDPMFFIYMLSALVRMPLRIRWLK
jgi:glycosyltransferase involved in cell wall biosynthesis